MDYASEIRRLRIEQGISFAALNKASGVAISTIQLIESGEANPTLETLNKLFLVFGYRLVLSAKKLRKTAEK